MDGYSNGTSSIRLSLGLSAAEALGAVGRHVLMATGLFNMNDRIEAST
jgi:hypothetical protein